MALKKLTPRQAGFIEGFATALEEVYELETGDHRSGKSYDPMTVSEDGTMMHSYAYDMKDGTRHHPVSDYESVDEIAAVLLDETYRRIEEAIEGGPPRPAGPTQTKKAATS